MSNRHSSNFVFIFLLIIVVAFVTVSGIGAGIISFLSSGSYLAQDDYFQKEVETQRNEIQEQREKISKQNEENWQLQRKLNAAELDLKRAKVEHEVLNVIVESHKEELMPRNYSSFSTTIYLNGRRGVLCSFADRDIKCFADGD